MKRKFNSNGVLCVFLLFLGLQLDAQINIKGLLLDEENNPLPETEVFLEWLVNNEVKRNFTSTLTDGSFFLYGRLPAKIVVLKPNFQFVELNVTDSSFKTIILKPIDSYKTIKPLTLIATRQSILNNNQSSLDKKGINQNNSITDLPDMLKMQPSVVQTSDAGNNIGYTGIRLRGTDGTRINITMNGIPMNDAESQSVYWVNMPDIASSLNSITITRGLGGSSNGAGAFGGTVSLESDDPATAPSKIDLAYGSFNTLRTTAIANSGKIGNFALGIRLSNTQSDGYIDRAASKLQSYMVNSTYQFKNSKLRFIHFAGKEQTYQAWYGLDATLLKTQRRYNMAGSYFDQNGKEQFYDNQTDNYEQSHYQLFYDRTIFTKNNQSLIASLGFHYTKGQGYYEEYQTQQTLSNYGVADTNNSNLVRQLHLLNDFLGTVYNLSYQSKKYQVLFGGSFNSYKGNHFGKIIRADFGQNIDYDKRYYDNDAQKTEWSNYLKINRPIVAKNARYNLFADLQIRNIHYQGGGIENLGTPVNFEKNYLFFNPKIGGTRTVYKAKNNLSKVWSLFLGVGNREPARIDFLSNTMLLPKAEQMLNVELGHTINHRKWVFMANYYLMLYKNQLVLTGELDNVGAAIRANVKESYRTGIELVGQCKLDENLFLNANLTLSQNRIKQWKETVYDTDTYADSIIERNNKPIAYSPSIIGALSLEYSLNKNTQITLQNKMVGSQFLDNTGIKEKSLAAYNSVNIIIEQKVNLQKIVKSNLPLNFSLYLNNITNALYVNNGGAYSYIYDGQYLNGKWVYPQAGFNIAVKCSLTF